MNLPYRCELLAAADGQRHGFIKLRGSEADEEVWLMVQEGLVEATFGDGTKESFTSINRILPAGRAFLRTHSEDSGKAAPAKSTAELQATVAAKWKSHSETGVVTFKPMHH